MKRPQLNTKFVIMMIAAGGFASACSDNYQLTQSPAAPSTDGDLSDSCTLTNVTVPVKIMFVVDTSGSNNSPTMDKGTIGCNPSDQTCAPATDPTKSFRLGSISAFFEKYESKTNFSWGFITFSDDSAPAYISGSQGPMFAGASIMQEAINEFETENDGGDTPYVAALSEVETAIANDPGVNASGASAPLYYVIFLSDGYPTDALTVSGTVDEAELTGQIQQITSLAPGRVFFSTVYYGTINDPNAAATLQGMASGGAFVNVDTSSTATIDIQDLIQVPTGQCN